ncbi:MAG: histidine kinase [Methylobacter sp.]|nr:MAG: histidine kinase [Methylobacter sp.]PPD19187.1 MAG: histidine kinase [Methylobacter sp.]
MDTIPNEKLARLSELPSLPTLFLDALQQINDDRYTSVLAEKIGNDPSLVARILRIANSSFYGRSREIGTVQEAILLLGLSRVRDILIAVCFSKLLPMPKTTFDYTQFWHHSMAVGECTRQLAHYSGINQDLAFTAGLLHDIGRLIIAVFFHNEINDLLNAGKPLSVGEEQQRLGFNHMQIGGKAALHWKFPQAIQEAIEQHETPPAPDAEKSLTVLVYAANLLIQLAEKTTEEMSDVPESLRPALDILAIPNDKSVLSVNNARQFADQIVAIL